MTARTIDAAEAERIGLVNRVVAPERARAGDAGARRRAARQLARRGRPRQARDRRLRAPGARADARDGGRRAGVLRRRRARERRRAAPGRGTGGERLNAWHGVDAGQPIVRDATERDAVACAAIYAPYVLDTAITFESEPPSPADMAVRIATALRSHAWAGARRRGAGGRLRLRWPVPIARRLPVGV